MNESLVYRLRSGGAVLDDGTTIVRFDHWRAAVAEALARGLRVSLGVPPLLVDPDRSSNNRDSPTL